jgi:hypothetical protein
MSYASRSSQFAVAQIDVTDSISSAFSGSVALMRNTRRLGTEIS